MKTVQSPGLRNSKSSEQANVYLGRVLPDSLFICRPQFLFKSVCTLSLGYCDTKSKTHIF
jgi:hypothetical protein